VARSVPAGRCSARWVEAHRARSGNQYLDEWFEWLYLQLDRYLNKKTAPAALAHLDWRP